MLGVIKMDRDQVTRSEHEYLSFYGIDETNLSNYKRVKLTKRSIETTIHVFEPSKINKTVLLIHGYFDHTGSLKNLINFFLAKDWRVISYDLQGHGLSTGNRGEIKDFQEYVQMFQSVLVFCEEQGVFPNSVVAHSTGAAICTDFLLEKSQSPFEKVIYLAPLVRTSNWQFIITGAKIIPFFIRKLTRRFRTNSGDKEYLKFVRNDPLQSKFISIPWVLALINWDKKIKQRGPSTTDLLVIQGTDDATVDWKYNLPFLKKKFPSSKLVIIDDGKHQLANDCIKIRKVIFNLIEANI